MIVLTLPTPPSANRIWKTRVAREGGRYIAQTYLTPEARAYKDEVGWLAKKAGISQPMPGRVWFDLQLYPALPDDFAQRYQRNQEGWDDDVRRLDLDNARKLLYDALQNICYGNDKLIFKDSGEVMEPDRHGPRVVVTIRQIARVVPQLKLFEETTS
jgi:crossover junction endodeoxyribonuclease RusA